METGDGQKRWGTWESRSITEGGAKMNMVKNGGVQTEDGQKRWMMSVKNDQKRGVQTEDGQKWWGAKKHGQK